MFHPLALVKIEDGRTKHFLEALLQVTFIDGYLPAQLLDGDGLTNLLEQDLAGSGDLFPVGLISQELVGHHINLLVFHAIQAVEQKHLGLGIHENILQVAGIGIVKESFQHKPRARTHGKYF